MGEGGQKQWIMKEVWWAAKISARLEPLVYRNKANNA